MVYADFRDVSHSKKKVDASLAEKVAAALSKGFIRGWWRRRALPLPVPFVLEGDSVDILEVGHNMSGVETSGLTVLILSRPLTMVEVTGTEGFLETGTEGFPMISNPLLTSVSAHTQTHTFILF